VVAVGLGEMGFLDWIMCVIMFHIEGNYRTHILFYHNGQRN
jgi:hypothetical protein